MRKMTEKEHLSWDARQVGEFGKNRDGSPRPSLKEVTARRHAKEAREQTATVYKSQSARDAQEHNIGGKSYWDMLDRHAEEMHDYFIEQGDTAKAEEMMTRNIGEALAGNNGD